MLTLLEVKEKVPAKIEAVSVVIEIRSILD